jgi:hypothetical protein
VARSEGSDDPASCGTLYVHRLGGLMSNSKHILDVSEDELNIDGGWIGKGIYRTLTESNYR